MSEMPSRKILKSMSISRTPNWEDLTLEKCVRMDSATCSPQSHPITMPLRVFLIITILSLSKNQNNLSSKPDSSNAANDSQACLKGRVSSLSVAATRNATMRASVCRQHADDTPTESPFRHAVSDTDTDAVLLLNLSTKLDPGH